MSEEEQQDNAGQSASSEMIATSDLPDDTSLQSEYEEICSGTAGQVPVQVSDDSDVLPDGRRPMKIFCHACGQKLDLSHLEPFSHIACPACGTDLIVPRWFDNYLLEEIAGIGGMATVYRALDLALDREVAIKVLKPDLAFSVDKSELFLHEARTAATINHHAVIPIYTCGIFENQTYIVMQYMGGGSLESTLLTASEPLPLPSVVYWIRDVAAGLENARQRGIVHHDMKPANIMLDTDGKAKIGDFGIAQIVSGKAKDSAAAEELSQGWVSPHYASPEKIRTGEEDFRGDIYSLGATFYHLVTGLTPYPNVGIDELIQKRLTEEPMMPNLQRKDLPEPLSALIMAMMARDPEQRPDYPAILEKLDSFLSGQMQNQEARNASGASAAPRKKHPAGGAKKRSGKAAAALAPVPKKKEDFSVAFFKFVTTGFSLLLVAVTILFLLFRFDTLNNSFFFSLFPRILQEMKKPMYPEQVEGMQDSLVDMLQGGRPDLLLKEKRFLSNSNKKKKMKYALQYCYALYLENDSHQDPYEPVNELTDAILNEANAYMHVAFEDHLLLLQYFSGKISTDQIENDLCVFPHAEDYTAKLALVDLLLGMKNGTLTKDDRIALFDNFKSELMKLQVKNGCWLFAAFADRLPYWDQTLRTGKGVKNDVEPLFRPFITEEGKWEFVEPEKRSAAIRTEEMERQYDEEKVKREQALEAKKAEEKAQREAITAENLEKASAVYRNKGNRPVNEFQPFQFIGDDNARSNYISSVQNSDLKDEQKAAEEARVKILGEIKPYLVSWQKVSGLKNFMVKSAGKTERGSGTVSFDEDYGITFSFEPEYDDEDPRTVERTWEKFRVDELVALFRSYCMRKKPSNMKDTEYKEDRIKACFYLGAVCYWYGKYSDAEKAFSSAMKLSGDSEELKRKISDAFMK